MSHNEKNGHLFQKTIKDIKKMFASEIVRKVVYIHEVAYYDKRTNERISKIRYMQILSGNY